jgi:uncharacterized protein involved in exopolysaccharide biosynthesis
MADRKGPKSKEELKSFEERIVHQFHVISEDVISQVKQVAEGVINVNGKLERFREEVKFEIENKTQPIAQAVLALDGKLEKTREELEKTRQELRKEIQETRQELKTEIQESRQEVLAAVKFSYAELDRRLTTLENEFVELRRRVEKIEDRSVS